MSLWTNNDFRHFQLRDTQYNKSVCLNKINLEKIVSRFDTVFDSIVNFTDELTGLIMYPINILPYMNPTKVNVLKTSKGIFNDINVYSIDYSAYYTTLGEFHVIPRFFSFLDYKGYTQIKVCLPFLGFVDVDVNECMGKWLQFRLLTDFNSGKGLYIIGVSDESMNDNFLQYPYPGRDEDEGMRILYTYECDIGIDIPLGQSNVGDIKRNLLLGTIKTIASAGFASYTNSLPPQTTTTQSSKVYDVYGRSTRKGSRMKQIKSGTEEFNSTTTYNKPIDKSKPISEVIDCSVDVLNRIHSDGNGDRINDAGLMWGLSQSIFVVRYTPKVINQDASYSKLYGHPLGEVRTLSELAGYTEISSIHIEGEKFNAATKNEIDILENALTNGIIL